MVIFRGLIKARAEYCSAIGKFVRKLLGHTPDVLIAPPVNRTIGNIYYLEGKDLTCVVLSEDVMIYTDHTGKFTWYTK